MGQASRNERKQRRQKLAVRQGAQRKARTNRQYLSALSSRVINAQFTLLAILQAQGGSVVVAKDVAAGVMTDFAHLAFMTERQEDGSMKVTLTDNRTGAADVVEPPTASDTNIPLAPREPLVPERTDVIA